MDLAQLSQLPLSVLVIVGSYWVIQRLHDEHAKRLIALIADFSAKYQAIIDRNREEREESRARWLERDKVLIETLMQNQRALVENVKETHALRGALTPLVLWFESERNKLGQSPPRRTRSTGGNPDGTS